eukprot:g69332.t1
MGSPQSRIWKSGTTGICGDCLLEFRKRERVWPLSCPACGLNFMPYMESWQRAALLDPSKGVPIPSHLL